MKKRLFAAALCAVVIFAFAGCGGESSASEPATEAQDTASATVQIKDHKADIDKELEEIEFEGVVYITQNGEVAYEYANGKGENGAEFTVDTPLPIGSTSKQFCATSVIMLRDQGKLSVDDKLSKYFPEYEIGKDITVKNLLTMRSGILDMVNQGSMNDLATGKTEEENVELIKNWIFEQTLQFEPGTSYAYSNSNFFLLANIVEQVSGESYSDYVRKNIFEPLGMTHSGFIDELKDNKELSAAVSADELEETKYPGLAKGAGDIVTNGPDMDKWMTALSGGKLVSEESFKEMTEDHSPDFAENYGYGLQRLFNNGIGHPGAIDAFSALDYINGETGCNLFVVTNDASKRSIFISMPERVLDFES